MSKNGVKPIIEFTEEPARKKHVFKLPPNCRTIELCGLARRLRLTGDREGMGMPVLTDDCGRPVVKDVSGLKPGEICFVLR